MSDMALELITHPLTANSWKKQPTTPNVVSSSELLPSRSTPYISLIPSFSYLSTYTIIGGMVGLVYGYEIAEKKRYNVLITPAYVADLNYGYMIWGGFTGMMIGSITGRIINWL